MRFACPASQPPRTPASHQCGFLRQCSDANGEVRRFLLRFSGVRTKECPVKVGDLQWTRIPPGERAGHVQGDIDPRNLGPTHRKDLAAGVLACEERFGRPKPCTSSEPEAASRCCTKQNATPELSARRLIRRAFGAPRLRPTIDHCDRWLDQLGWSVEGLACRYLDGSGGWQLDAIRDGHTIVARAATQTDAWLLACRLAVRMERAG